MSLLSRILAIESKFAWSFLGVLLALLFGAITLYSNFARRERPHLRVDVLANATVLDVREQVGGFQVLFDGVDIGETSQTLRVITVEFKNDGRASILKSYYDENALPGIKLSSGRIVEKAILGASSEYLSGGVKLQVRDDRLLTFSPVIMEPADAFRVKIILLDSIGSELQIFPIGKIAQVRQIELAEPYKLPAKVSFARRAFAASLPVQGIRIVVYAVAALLLLLFFIFGLVMPISLLGERLGKARRRRIVKRFLALTGKGLSDGYEKILEGYIDVGERHIRSAINLIRSNDEEELVERLEHFRKYKEAYRARYAHPHHIDPEDRRLFNEALKEQREYARPRSYRSHEEWLAARDSFRLGAIELRDEEFAVNDERKEELERFATYLEKR